LGNAAARGIPSSSVDPEVGKKRIKEIVDKLKLCSNCAIDTPQKILFEEVKAALNLGTVRAVKETIDQPNQACVELLTQ
jgi:hypothetical protein